MQPLHTHFTAIDWIVLFGYLGLTTVVGHLLRGNQASIRDFFLGGRTLPWMAVTGSIVATEISGVTFIGVPGTLFALGGDFGYLQWAIGSILARVVIGYYFVGVYYEREIYSPYDYMSNRLGTEVKRLATVFFSVGSILAQSVRVLVAALPLKVVTPLPFELCILVIGLFAIAWTLIGGMRTVIWTDVMQFFLFTVGGLMALFWVVTHLDGGWLQFWKMAQEGGKLDLWNFHFLSPPEAVEAFPGPEWLAGFRAELQFTFWVSIFAVPFLNLNAFGVDQLNAQRMFCCRNAGEARKAIIWSSAGQFVTLLMLMVGAALWVHYQAKPPTGAVADFFGWKDGVPAHPDNVFPTWIVTQLPPGLSGLILAGVFAAAISSLDSILAALSQTTLSMFHRTEDGFVPSPHLSGKLLLQSKVLVVAWGLILTGFTYLLYLAKDEIPILPLAFGMTAYTMGPMLAMFLCSLRGRGSFRGLLIGSVISFVLTMLVRTDIWVLLLKFGWVEPTLTASRGSVDSIYSYVWMWPLSTVVTLVCGTLIPPAGDRGTDRTAAEPD